MPKLPDISKYTDKIPGLVKNVKTMIDPTSALPDDTSGDPIAAKIKALTELVKKATEANVQQSKDIAKINTHLMELYKVVESLKAPVAGPEKSEPVVEKTEEVAKVEEATKVEASEEADKKDADS